MITFSPTQVLAASLLAALVTTGAPGAFGNVRIQSLGGKRDRLHVTIDGKMFTEYRFRNTDKPFLFPIVMADGAEMTRNYPTLIVPDEWPDHPHHRSLWFAHGSVNGHDFWSEQERSGRILHQEFTEIVEGPVGVIRSRNIWVSREGDPIITDERTVKFRGIPEGRIIDFEITLIASHGPVVFGDDKEGTMAIRVANTMPLSIRRPPDGERGAGPGRIFMSSGYRDGETWGKKAAWCHYVGPVDGKMMGIAIFDHPSNPRHPTWWHVRDYGLFAANPFGQHYFEELEDSTAGNLEVPANGRITFRYRFFFHEGDENSVPIAERYQDYVRQTR